MSIGCGRGDAAIFAAGAGELGGLCFRDLLGLNAVDGCGVGSALSLDCIGELGLGRGGGGGRASASWRRRSSSSRRLRASSSALRRSALPSHADGW